MRAVAWCETTLDVSLGTGGRQAPFGTHNRLVKIAAPMFEDSCLATIASDPLVPTPA